MISKEWIDICENVVWILEKRLYIPKEKLKDESWDTAFTSNYFGLEGIDLVYLLFELEKKYHIRIEERYLDNYQFNSIRSVTNILYEIICKEGRQA